MALYTATFNLVAVTGTQDLFDLLAATDSVTVVHSVELSQRTELGDAQEEMLNLIFERGATTASGGALVTANPLETGSSAYGGSVRVNGTTRSTGGTVVPLRVDNWNVRMPYLWLPTPEMRPILGPSTRFVVDLNVAPADAIDMSGTITFEELGG